MQAKTYSIHSNIKIYVILVQLLIVPLFSEAQLLPHSAANSTWQIAQGALSKEGVQSLGGNIVTPTLKWDYSTGLGAEGYPVIGDIDNDGENEIIAVNARTLYVLDGHTGTLEYQKALSYTNPAGLAPIIADLDADFENEIIVSTDSFLLALNAVDGSIQWSRFVAPYYFISFSGPVVADVDTDGNQDIVMFLNNGELRAFEGASGVDKWSYTTTSTSAYGELSCANIDTDPALEIVLCTFDGKMIAIDGATGMPEWTIGLPQNLNGLTPVISDVEDDGVLDIIVGNSVYYASNGSMRWADTITPYRGNSCVADLNDDGMMEIYYVTDKLYALDATTGGSLWSVQVDASPGLYAAGPIAVDMGGNEGKELVLATSYSANNNKVYLVDHSGVVVWTYQNPGRTAEGYAVGDIDNDGCSEIVLNPDCCYGTSSIYAIDDFSGGGNCSSPNSADAIVGSREMPINIAVNRGSILVSILYNDRSPVKLKLFDLNGKLIQSIDASIDPGNNIIEFHPVGISNSIYLLDIEIENRTVRRKFSYSSN